LILVVTLTLQFVAAGKTFEIIDQVKEARDNRFSLNTTSKAISDMNQKVQDQFIKIYDGKECAPLPDTVPTEISCKGSGTYFLEKFINEICLTPGSDSDQENGDFMECTYSGTGGSDGSKKAYCQCRSGVLQKMEDNSRPLAGLAIAIGVLELLLLIMALDTIFDDYCEGRGGYFKCRQSAKGNDGQPEPVKADAIERHLGDNEAQV